jgi:hypothetical protein
MDYDLGYFDLEIRVLEPLENPFGKSVTCVAGTLCNRCLRAGPGGIRNREWELNPRPADYESRSSLLSLCFHSQRLDAVYPFRSHSPSDCATHLCNARGGAHFPAGVEPPPLLAPAKPFPKPSRQHLDRTTNAQPFQEFTEIRKLPGIQDIAPALANHFSFRYLEQRPGLPKLGIRTARIICRFSSYQEVWPQCARGNF